ncbi:MAG: hypothetical protein M1816_007879 [Peltula sp. TS41687]|nr:MAG: hypothetical protein M1816_007879 [Peltula sp. TS41687]
MEYFDFEKASSDWGHDASIEQLPSSTSAFEVCPESLRESTFENISCNDLFDCPEQDLDAQMSVLPSDGMAGFGDFPSWIPRIAIPTFPCDYCRSRHLECLLVCEGRSSCSSCIALFRECSFVRKGPDAKEDELPLEPRRLDTLHGVVEDAVTGGGLTGKRSLRSLLGCTEEVDHAEVASSNKNRKRFSREAVKVLKDWLAQHPDHPYPTQKEKDVLKASTGLKRSQIATWLANARRRGKTRPRRPTSPSLGVSTSRAIVIPSSTPDSLSIKDMDPLERWKHSPPEHEPASVSAIAVAVATSNCTVSTKDASSSSNSWVDQQRDSSASSSFSVFGAPSMTSVESKRSSGSDFSWSSSAFSHQSQNSYGSMNALKRKDRRRRKRPAITRKSGGRQEVRTFQCTFCTDSFKTKYDWQRHEKSLHLSLERWTCSPMGGAVALDSQSVCVYCNAINPTPDHLATHNHQQCQDKHINERIFYRKDHLRQHLRLSHNNCQFESKTMESWKSSPQEVKSRCGFCDQVCTTWLERVDHLAGHFREGAQMANWKGDWGFDPHVVDVVENAMPPWMIDNERRTPIPFSAIGLSTLSHTSFLNQPPTTDHQQQQQPSTNIDDRYNYNYMDGRMCFQELERILSIWARDQRDRGRQLTDDMLQDEARRIVYMSTDPWNQTIADDPQWLGRFKRRYGLSPVREVSREEEDGVGGGGGGRGDLLNMEMGIEKGFEGVSIT